MSTTLLSSIIEHTKNERGFQVCSFSLMGDPHASAMVDAVWYDYHRVTGRPSLTLDGLRALEGTKVTVLRAGESAFGAGSIQTDQGTVFLARDQVALLPKGKRTKGYRLDPNTVLDVEVGYNREQVLNERVQATVRTFPEVGPLTRDDLLTLPEEAPDPAQIGLVVFGTWRGPEGASPGALWFLHSYIREDDIVEGCLIVRSEHGVSEHGSIHGDTLLRFGGRVLNAPAMSFAQTLDLCDVDYHAALARIVESGPKDGPA